MAKPARIVIDTNIVRGIGAAPSGRSTPLLDALDAAREGGLRLVRTAPLDEEWVRHSPTDGLFLEWLADMMSRGRVGRRELKTLGPLKKRLSHAVPAEALEAVDKDAHLAAVAIETDARVLSLDDKMRGHLARASAKIAELSTVLWANPALPEDAVGPWLLAGAPYEAPRTLAQHSGRPGRP